MDDKLEEFKRLIAESNDDIFGAIRLDEDIFDEDEDVSEYEDYHGSIDWDAL